MIEKETAWMWFRVIGLVIACTGIVKSNLAIVVGGAVIMWFYKT